MYFLGFEVNEHGYTPDKDRFEKMPESTAPETRK